MVGERWRVEKEWGDSHVGETNACTCREEKGHPDTVGEVEPPPGLVRWRCGMTSRSAGWAQKSCRGESSSQDSADRAFRPVMEPNMERRVEEMLRGVPAPLPRLTPGWASKHFWYLSLHAASMVLQSAPVDGSQ